MILLVKHAAKMTLFAPYQALPRMTRALVGFEHVVTCGAIGIVARVISKYLAIP